MMSRADKLAQLEMPYEQKVQRSKELIFEWFLQYYGKVFVSFSGGKDSTVLLHLARSIKGCENIKGVFVDTGLEYPEVRNFVKTVPNVEWIKPKLTFGQVIKKYGWPVVSKEQSRYIYDIKNGSETLKNLRLNGGKKGKFKISEKWKYLLDAEFKISDRCCYIMKKNTAKSYEKKSGEKPIVGTMAHESNLRMQKYMGSNCNAFSAKHPSSHPIMFRNEQDILRYIVENGLNVASVYGNIEQTSDGRYYTTGLNRTGCMFCMYGVHLEGHPNRFEIMKQTHPYQYEYIMDKLGGREVLNTYLCGNNLRVSK